MGLGRQGDRQISMWLNYYEIPKSKGHAFYDRLQAILLKGGFDRFAEELCRPYYAERGRRSIPPGRYFRMLLVGYFEAIDSERGIEWRCADSLSLREFLQLDLTESVPDHSSLSRIRSRLPLEVHDQVFVFVLKMLAKQGLLKGRQLGIDASTMEANASLRTIVRRDTGETYREMLKRMAKESGIETPTAEELVRIDRNRKGKKLSNEDWVSKVDDEARIAKLKDGRTHMAYKPEHAVDLDSGAIVSAKIHHADKGDTTTIHETLDDARDKLKAATGKAPKATNPCDVVADKGYHSRETIKDLTDGPWKTRIAEPKQKGLSNWKGDHDARRAVYNNRARLGSHKAKVARRKRTELVERSFEHMLDRGGSMRCVWLRGQENIEKRYLIHAAGFNLGLMMRTLYENGTPREAAENIFVFFLVLQRKTIFLTAMVVQAEDHHFEILFFGIVAAWC